MVKCLTHGLRGFNGVVQRRLATLMVTMLISSCWQLPSEVESRRIFDVCKRWANSGSHEFVKKNIINIKDFYYNHQSVYIKVWSVLIHPQRSCTNCFYQLSIIKNWILTILANDHRERVVPSEHAIAHKFCELKSLHHYRTNTLSVR